MSQASFVNYQIAMTPENAEKIDAVNRIMLGGAYTQEAPAKKSATTATETGSSTAKKTSDPVSADNQRESAKEAATDGMSLAEFKEAAKQAKKDFGEEFAMQVLEQHGVETKSTLGRSMAAVDAGKYEAIVAEWKEGPQESDDLDDDLDDDGFDDEEDDTSEIDPEAVKTALKAYAKEVGRDEAKKIMTDNGAEALSKVGNCNQKQLQAMMKALV